ncbi:hypothetical protein DFH11DRAFT_413220 [Phellopilus nigrolimitatus]|nr:hypothetical protein DFH11DRAFT_413220 [Phellopilus nigrolimitatus]
MNSSHYHVTLPDDIIRLIIDVFIQESTSDAFCLFLISSSVKEWAEPHLYSKIVLRTRKQVLSFSSALRGDFAFCQPARHVKFLWLLCTDVSVTHVLHDVPVKCQNLIHFAFDAKRAPFVVPYTARETDDQFPRLSRLSICSPMLLDDQFYTTDPPVPFEHLTHLHLFAPCDPNSEKIYDVFLANHIDRLVSLTHLLIEVTIPSPESGYVNLSFLAEYAVFAILMREEFFRDLLVRVPTLRKLVIKTNYPYQRFYLLWDQLKSRLKDEPRVIFDLQNISSADADRLENSLSSSQPTISIPTWQKLLCVALDESIQHWSKS